MQSLQDGTQLGVYKVVRLVGHGGMGEVYEALEERLQRRVALKVISPQKAGVHGEVDLVRRFLQEARTLAQINHPNVVTIYAIDNIDSKQIIAMEFVDGALLKDVFALYALSADEAVPLFLQMLEGLHSLHDNRILHRDLKPHNLMVRPNGQVKILDFGIAKRLGDASAHQTTVGVVVGTLAYLPPEVLQGRPATNRSDIWSLGAIFYECVVGQPLVTLTSEKVKGVLAYEGSEVIFPEECVGWVPEKMRVLIGRMCARRPDERFASVSEVIDALKGFQQDRTPLNPAVSSALFKAIENLREAKRAARANKDFAGPKAKRELLVAQMKAHGSPAVEAPMPLSDTGRPTPDNSNRVYTEIVRESVSARQRAKRRSRGRKWIGSTGIVAGMVLACALFYTVAVNKGRGPVLHETPRPAVEPVRVSTDPTLPQGLVLTSPTRHHTLWLKPNEIPTLAWSKVLNSGDYELQIASDADFVTLVARETVSGTSYRPPHVLSEGPYSWRLKPLRGQRKPIGPTTFTISYLTGPEVLYPNAEQSFELSRFGKLYDVGIGWRCKPGAMKYRAQVSAEPSFQVLLKEQVLTNCSVPQIQLPVGTYHWRVRIEEPAIAREPWSPTRSFVVRPALYVPPVPVPVNVPVAEKARSRPANRTAPFEKNEPRLLNAKQSVTLQFKDRNVGRDLASARKQILKPPVFSWRPVKGAQSYRVQIAWNPEFSRLLSEESVSEPHFEWKQVVPGRMYWRVRAVNEAGTQSGFSERGQIETRLPAPKLSAAYSFSAQGTLEWPPVPLAEKYLVQWSAERSMASVGDKTIAQPQMPLELKGPEPLYVRVAAVSNNGERVSDFSRITSVTLEAPLPTASPQLVMPRKGAHAVVGGSGRVSVVFSWTKVDDATGYQIEVSADPDFKKLIEQKTLKTHHSILKEAELLGQVYWRVRADGPRGLSEWSPTGSFEVR